jgi:succinoglycan biosynthesis transport protein ExoP
MLLLLSFTILGGLTVYVYTRPVYYTRTLIDRKDMPLPVTTEDIHKDSNPREILTQFNSPHLTERTASKFGVNMADKYIRRKFLKKVTYVYNLEGNIEVEVWAWSRDMAENWSKTMLEEFLSYRAEQRAKRRELIYKDFTSEMQRVSQKMEEWVNSNYSYQDSNRMASLKVELRELQAVPTELARLNYLAGELTWLESKLKNDKLDVIERLSMLDSHAGLIDLKVGDSFPYTRQSSFDNLFPNNAPAGQPGAESREVVVVPAMASSDLPKAWTDLEKELRQTRNEQKELAKVYLPAHPRMKAASARLEQIEKLLRNELESGLSRVQLRLGELASRKEELAKKMPEYLDAQKQDAKLKLGFDQLAASQLTWRAFYDKMAKSISLVEFAEEKERIFLNYSGTLEARLDPPASPSRMNLFLMSMGLWCVLAIGIPFLIEYLDHTIGTIEAGEDTLRLRALGVVPQLSSGQRNTEGKDGAEQSTLTENFRVIRTNLLFNADERGGGKVVMVASAMPQEGKTYVARNIAVSFARKGERTLIIDADVRRGTLHEAFKISSAPGLVEVLHGGLGLESAVRPSGIARLDVLTRGKFVESVTDQFGEKAFADMIATFREKYDRIIVDTPPVLGLAETSALLSLVDGVVFVVWSGRTPLRNVQIAIDTLRANGANFYGFILNRLDLSATSNYYYYYYYSHNYYESYNPVDRS